MKYYRILSFILTGVLLCGTVSYAAEPESRKTEGTSVAFFKDADGSGKDEKGLEIPGMLRMSQTTRIQTQARMQTQETRIPRQEAQEA